MKQPASAKKRRKLQREGIGPHVQYGRRSLVLSCCIFGLLHLFPLGMEKLKALFIQIWQEMGSFSSLEHIFLTAFIPAGVILGIWIALILLAQLALSYGIPFLRNLRKPVPKSKGQQYFLPIFMILFQMVSLAFLMISFFLWPPSFCIKAGLMILVFYFLLSSGIDFILANQYFKEWSAMDPREVEEEFREEYGNPVLQKYRREEWNTD